MNESLPSKNKKYSGYYNNNIKFSYLCKKNQQNAHFFINALIQL